MKFIKNIFPFFVALLTIPLHQSCIENVDLELDPDFDGFVIDANLVYPNTIHYVNIRKLNKQMITNNYKDISVQLTDDNGKTIVFRNVKTIPIDTINYYFPLKLDSTDTNKQRYYYNSNKTEDRWLLLKYIDSEENYVKRFVAIDQNLEIGRDYTLSVTIGDKVYCATEKLLPPIEIISLKYKPVQKVKGIWQTINMLCPTFGLVNKSENHSNYFLARKGNDSLRIFHTKNMNDTISELQFNEYNYEPSYEVGSIPFSNSDSWFEYEDDDIFDSMQNSYLEYSFYPLSKNNYDYYKAIEKQIRTDGGIYSPTAATPISNFSGDNIYGQFIVTSESVISSKEALNYNEIVH